MLAHYRIATKVAVVYRHVQHIVLNASIQRALHIHPFRIRSILCGIDDQLTLLLRITAPIAAPKDIRNCQSSAGWQNDPSPVLGRYLASLSAKVVLHPKSFHRPWDWVATQDIGHCLNP